MGAKLRWERACFYCFDTVNTIDVYSESRNPLEEAVALCNRFQRLFNRFDPGSDIGRLAASGGTPVKVAPETAELLCLSRRFQAETEGAFHIGAGTISSLWGFGGQPAVPKRESVEKALQCVRSGAISVRGDEAVCPAGVIPDLGGIAKGYAADKIAAILKRGGVECGIVNLGGNILTLGQKPNGEPWAIGIRSPMEKDRMCAALSLKGRLSVVTSGKYERCFSSNGHRYHHIIDLSTGAPAENELESVTVVAPDSTTADALSTALLCLGKDRGMALLPRFSNVKALFISADGGFSWSGEQEVLHWYGVRGGL